MHSSKVCPYYLEGPLPNLITAFAHREPTIKLGEFRWIELYSKRIHFRRVGLTRIHPLPPLKNACRRALNKPARCSFRNEGMGLGDQEFISQR